MPQQDQRLASATGDRGIRDLEGVGLDAARVVLLDRDLGDLVAGVGEQLLARGRELSEVVGERGDEGAQGSPVMRRPAAENSAAANSLFSASFFSSRQAISMPPPEPARMASSRRLPRTPGVPQDEIGVVGGMGEVVDRLRDEGVGALLDTGDPDQSRLVEERRAREREQ